MPNGSNVAKYQEIYAKKQANPALSLAKLCDEAGTTYQSYNNWVKKHHRKVGTNSSSKDVVRMTIQVSLVDLANLVASGGKTLPVRVEDVLRGVPPQDLRQLAGHLGMMRLERLQSGGGGGSKKDSDSEEAQA